MMKLYYRALPELLELFFNDFLVLVKLDFALNELVNCLLSFRGVLVA